MQNLRAYQQPNLVASYQGMEYGLNMNLTYKYTADDLTARFILTSWELARICKKHPHFAKVKHDKKGNQAKHYSKECFNYLKENFETYNCWK